MISMTYFKTYAGHVTAYKRGSYLPRRSKSTSESQNDSHTAPSGLKLTQTRTLFTPLSAVICRSMAQWHTLSCLSACLTNCSPPSENPAMIACSHRLTGYRCWPATRPPKQGAKGRRKRTQNSTPSEPAGRQGQESLKWCCIASKSFASGEIATVLSEDGSERAPRLL